MTPAMTTARTLTTSPWPGMGAVVATFIAAMTPAFAISALATPIERALHLSGTGFGLALSGFFAMTALGSPVARRVAVRLPVPVLLALVCGTAALCLPLATTGTAGLALALLLAGAGNALTQPAAARYIAGRVPAQRLSLATGLTGAALGAAPMLPGLLAGQVAEPLGWRLTLLLAAGFPLLALAFTPLARTQGHPVAASGEAAPLSRTLVLWTVGAALATIGSNATASFFVQLGTGSGLSTTVAGTMLSLASLLAVAVRLVAGVRADRAPQHNPLVVAAMMLSGALGLVLIALGTPVTFVLGAVLVVAGGWGWTGLLLSAVLRLLPGQAARAGATVQIGLFGGAALAPFAFGALSSSVGTSTAVLLAAGCALAGALAVRVGAALTRVE
ncbi:MFS family permease [Kutzneria viridogrisea]|uniref:MFS family permease n=1 Tax=Kutzneria viridogrisea TaxID=47990 RepID=A0ABR6BH02_9PSEU|nr:MFS family permease [Kutzneria viridogrisea]